MPRRLIFSLVLLFATFAGTNAQTPAPRPKPDGPTTGASSSTLRIELPTPIAETPVPLVDSGRGSLQTLSFVTPDANFERAVVRMRHFPRSQLPNIFRRSPTATGSRGNLSRTSIATPPVEPVVNMK